MLFLPLEYSVVVFSLFLAALLVVSSTQLSRTSQFVACIGILCSTQKKIEYCGDGDGDTNAIMFIFIWMFTKWKKRRRRKEWRRKNGAKTIDRQMKNENKTKKIRTSVNISLWMDETAILSAKTTTTKRTTNRFSSNVNNWTECQLKSKASKNTWFGMVAIERTSDCVDNRSLTHIISRKKKNERIHCKMFTMTTTTRHNKIAFFVCYKYDT